MCPFSLLRFFTLYFLLYSFLHLLYVCFVRKNKLGKCFCFVSFHLFSASPVSVQISRCVMPILLPEQKKEKKGGKEKSRRKRCGNIGSLVDSFFFLFPPLSRSFSLSFEADGETFYSHHLEQDKINRYFVRLFMYTTSIANRHENLFWKAK